MSELIWPLPNRRTVMVQDDLGLQTWRVNIFPWYTFHRESVFRVNSVYGNTVEPVYNGLACEQAFFSPDREPVHCYFFPQTESLFTG